MFTEIMNLYTPMEISIIIGYIGAFLVGFVLGLLGGGGAMLSIPVLVYLFHIQPITATGYSLFLVGVAASLGAVQNVRKKMIDYSSALYYGIPSVLSVYLMRRFIIHRLPDTLFSIGNYEVGRDNFILVIFAMVMFAAAYKMIFSAEVEEHTGIPTTADRARLVLYAILVGIFSGFVGAGGGFLITPVLIYQARLSVKKAIGTSLVLVAVNAFIGFIGDLGATSNMDWKFLLTFSAFSIAGVIIGSRVGEKVHNKHLKQYFGWFIVAIAIWIIIRETLLK